MELDIRNEIRKAIAAIIEEENALKEIDLISKSKNDWNETKRDLKDTISKLILQLEKDDYSDAVKNIDKTIDGLKKWKQKINKNI